MQGIATSADEIVARLAQPFHDSDIEWRVCRAGIKGGRPWAQVLAYVDARAARARLNAVLGAANWTVAYLACPVGGVLALLSLRIDGEWISKQDGADSPEREPVKGALSNAFKRACAVWGIGEHLYDVGEAWATFSETGAHRVQIDGKWFRWDPPALLDSISEHEPFTKGAPGIPRRAPALDGSLPASSMASPTLAAVGSMTMPFGKHRGMALRDIPLEDLKSARDWSVQKRRSYPEFLAAVAVLEGSHQAAA
jgi:hypothetical protein